MLLKNGKALQINEDGIVFNHIDIRIDGQIIHETGSMLIPHKNEEYIDLCGDIVLPGMVNSHYHSYTNIIRGTSWGEPLEIWSSDTVNLGSVLGGEDMELSVALGICEMLRSGVTACVDHLPHLKTAHNAAEVYSKSGFRAGLAPMLHNIRDCDFLHGMKNESSGQETKKYFPSIEEYLSFYDDFIRHFHSPEGTLKVIIGINSPQRADAELLEASSYMSDKYGLSVHCHLLETRWQQMSSDNNSIIGKLDSFGLLKPNTSLAHCIWLNEREMDIVAQRRSMVVSNPASNLFLGSGIFPAHEYLKRDIPIALGSDGSNCGTNHNMLEILRLFLLMQRNNQNDYRLWIDSMTAYAMVTKNGSNVLNFPVPSGFIETGYAADLAIADKNSVLGITDLSLMNELIFHTPAVKMKHVLVNGRFLMKDSKITAIDEDALRNELSERKSYLAKSINKALVKASSEKQVYRPAYEILFQKSE